MPARSLLCAAAIVAATVVATASAASAQGGSPPSIDVHRVCQAAASEITSLFGTSTQDVLGTCVQDEEAARDQLTQNWGDFPSLAKARCVNPREYLPSYVEWTACLEMTRDVIKMRQEREAGVPDATRECPIVKTGEDGNVAWVDNCRFRRRR